MIDINLILYTYLSQKRLSILPMGYSTAEELSRFYKSLRQPPALVSQEYEIMMFSDLCGNIKLGETDSNSTYNGNISQCSYIPFTYCMRRGDIISSSSQLNLTQAHAMHITSLIGQSFKFQIPLFMIEVAVTRRRHRRKDVR